MTRAMDLDRFEALAEAFGGDIARWPALERPTALEFAAAEPVAADKALSEAARLDSILGGGGFVPVASDRLRARIMAAAPRGRFGLLTPSLARRWMPAAGLGAVLAAACVAGVAAGVWLGPGSMRQTGRASVGVSVETAAMLLSEPRDPMEG